VCGDDLTNAMQCERGEGEVNIETFEIYGAVSLKYLGYFVRKYKS
jgi:hypothetical protein